MKLNEKMIVELKEIEDDYKRAYQLISYLFKDKVDKANKSYINHLVRVSEKLKNPNTRIAGLLHDSIEDINDFTANDLRELKFNEDIITLVQIVTNIPAKNKTYHEKITTIINSNNMEAIKLKYADISDNYSIERLNQLDEKTRKYLINKYKNEIIRLENILTERGEKL